MRDGVVVNVGDVYADTDVGYKTLEVARLAGYRVAKGRPRFETALREGE